MRAFELEKREGDGREHDVVRPAPIAPSFKVIESEIVFELLILLLDQPAAAGEGDQLVECRRRRRLSR